MRHQHCVPHLLPLLSHFMMAQHKEHIEHIDIERYISYYIHQLN